MGAPRLARPGDRWPASSGRVRCLGTGCADGTVSESRFFASGTLGSGFLGRETSRVGFDVRSLLALLAGGAVGSGLESCACCEAGRSAALLFSFVDSGTSGSGLRGLACWTMISSTANRPGER